MKGADRRIRDKLGRSAWDIALNSKTMPTIERELLSYLVSVVSINADIGRA